MSSHLRLSTMSQHAHQGDVAAVAEVAMSETLHAQPRPTLASPPVWKHKLILMGRLDHRSTPDLEEEIECLCQEGVTMLTLDLRQLTAIDSAGIKAIAFRGVAYRRLGRDFEVVSGSHDIGSALADAGAADLLAPDREDTVVRLPSGRPLDGFLSDRSTAMIKSL
jgi:anti-anti-sigma factor